MPIRFYDYEVTSGLNAKKNLKKFIEAVSFQYLDIKELDINFIFCNDKYLLQKNMAYLQHNTYTDILTFDLSKSKDIMQAEIYISVDRVRDNASKFEQTYILELHCVIFHGLLHLYGYNDSTEEEKIEMRAKEQEFLQLYFNQE